jgi:hypothetical protein
VAFWQRRGGCQVGGGAADRNASAAAASSVRRRCCCCCYSRWPGGAAPPEARRRVRPTFAPPPRRSFARIFRPGVALYRRLRNGRIQGAIHLGIGRRQREGRRRRHVVHDQVGLVLVASQRAVEKADAVLFVDAPGRISLRAAVIVAAVVFAAVIVAASGAPAEKKRIRQQQQPPPLSVPGGEARMPSSWSPPPSLLGW